MSSVLGSLRRVVFAPSLYEVTMRGRGFEVPDTAATRQLERVPQAVVCGFEWGIDAQGLWDVEQRLGMVDKEVQGFAYEGATMAFTILDTMGPGQGKRTKELLLGPGQPHIFLAYIGIGFAMSKLPRVLWKKVLPDLEGTPYHPVMSWLAVDGYGFDLAYFHPEKWVDGQARPKPYPWLGYPGYFQRAADQGVGRALWFMHGGQVHDVTAAVTRFDATRHADLWSGVGLASTFAGGAEPEELSMLRKAAGEHAAHLGQGAVFAAKARTYSGHVPEHSAASLTALTDLTMAEADVLADAGLHAGIGHEAGTGVTNSVTDNVTAEPAYETWRAMIRERLA